MWRWTVIAAEKTQEALSELRDKLPSTEYIETLYDFSSPVAAFDAEALDCSKEYAFVVYSPQSTLDVFVYGMTPPAAFNLVVSPDGTMILQARDV